MLHRMRVRAATAFFFSFLATTIATHAFASTACVPSSGYRHDGGALSHPNLPNNGVVWGGTIGVNIDGGDPYDMYCIDINHWLCKDNCLAQGPNIAAPEILWILHNYYPVVPSEPLGLTPDKQARAVQLAIWHFSDGLDISTGGTPTDVFNTARAIVAAAQSAPAPQCPTTVTVTPSGDICQPGSHVTLTLCVLDQDGNPVENQDISLTITGANAHGPVTLTTDYAGKVLYGYTGNNVGTDNILAEV
ncbi:MAG: Cys-Gln thioester bond-forming surface protein, partial [Candidatus Eisenbacteria bacterium]|nr:Cys-Gln thioester bond-forming surface protein [Candidatus Eisenbacteria bacterium]